jgi:hypothetical protein
MMLPINISYKLINCIQKIKIPLLKIWLIAVFCYIVSRSTLRS